jgi:calcium-dependent protein kinase
MSPEILNKNYDSKCDIWACGVITYVLIAGNYPFDGPSNKIIYSKIKKGEVNFKSAIWDTI